METNNGKLLGNTNSDSEQIINEFRSVNQDIDEMRQYLCQLEQRYQKLEVSLDVKHRQHLQAYQDELRSIQSPVRQIAVRLTALEKSKLSRIKTNFDRSEQQISKRVFWLGFYSSLIFGFISVWNWFELHRLDESMTQKISVSEEIVREYLP